VKNQATDFTDHTDKIRDKKNNDKKKGLSVLIREIRGKRL